MMNRKEEGEEEEEEVVEKEGKEEEEKKEEEEVEGEEEEEEEEEVEEEEERVRKEQLALLTFSVSFAGHAGKDSYEDVGCETHQRATCQLQEDLHPCQRYLLDHLVCRGRGRRGREGGREKGRRRVNQERER